MARSFVIPQINYLSHLFIKDFRNIVEIKLDLHRKTNLFYGMNGQGKTNFLEAIALACSLKPMQPLHSSDLIRYQHSQAKIIANFLSHECIEIDIFAAGKKAKLNNQQLRNVAALQGIISVVSFIPAELMMISGTASLRRRALDQAASSLFFEHLKASRAYDKLLLHRNKLLKDLPLDRLSLAAFTELFINEAAEVIFFRLKTIEALAPYFCEKISLILGQQYYGSIHYLHNETIVNNYTINDIKAVLNNEYKQLEQQEQRRRVSLFGPHLHDIKFCINDENAKNAASRGQTRAIVLAFKLAHMMAIHRVRGISPVIILDDIVSELDAARKANLIQVIDDLQCQAFFSATDLNDFGKLAESAALFHVRNGAVV